MEAFDEDIAIDDSLGKTKSISFVTLVEDEEEHDHEMILFDNDGKKSGTLWVKTRFLYIPPAPLPNPILNRNCLLKLKILHVSTFKDHDTFGK